VFPPAGAAAYLRAMNTQQDAGRVWLITGCSAGFGRAIAEAALERGDRVVATARRPETLADLAGDDVLAVKLDVTRRDDVEAAVAAALERFGRIDVVVNNAGYGSIGAVEEIDLDDLRALMDTMFFGAVALTQAVLPHMRAQRSGTIVQMSSQGGQFAFAGVGAYCAAKFALEGLSEALDAEVAPLGIRTLIVEPGSFRTEFGGSRMHRSREIDAYAQTVGPSRAFLDGMDGTQPGDPRKAAAAILAAVYAPTPPLRLALGADAVDAIRAKHERLRTDLDGWEAVSRDTAVDDAQP
jgi:NAD(P)-dependent dehydrogenase (short-subunit alcohol dehydrogenase family)